MVKLIEEYEKLSDLTDNDVYALNPFVRLRNEHAYVVAYGTEGRGNYKLPHSYGVILSLCDGRRTVGDIAKLVTPFVKKNSYNNPLDEARKRVYKIVDMFRRSYAEQKNPAVAHDGSQAFLIPASRIPDFSPTRPRVYDAKRFLPKYAFPRGDYDYRFRERVPGELLWHLTSECATNCQYCYLGRRSIPKSRLISKKRMLEILDEAKRIGVFSVDPTGGDVILYPYLFDFLDEHQTHQFIPIRISTKAFVSKEMARRLAQYHSIFEIQFSIDSTVEEVADYLVQKPGFCKKAMESIDNVLEAGLRVAAKAIITPYNVCTIPRFYRTLRRRGVGDIRLATYCRSGYHHRDGLFNHIEDYNWLDKQLDVLGEEFPGKRIAYQNGRPTLSQRSKQELQLAWKERTRCAAGRTSILICADGKVIPCEQLPETEEMFIGDVTVQSIEEIWNSKKLDEMTIQHPREKFRNTICYNCLEIEECHQKMGYCIRDTYQDTGTIYDAAPGCPKSDRFVRKF